MIHQLPPKPDYLRVKVRRRLQRIGAVALKNTVYVLPAGDESREDLHWLRGEILAEDGEAMICEATFEAGIRDEELVATFRREREAEYAELSAAVQAAGPTIDEVESARFRRQLMEVVRRDYFGAEGRAAVEHALALGEAQARGSAPASESPAPNRSPRPKAATWVTRAGIYVDRMASAWLIRRFIDPAAFFRFVPAVGYSPGPGELRFDMFEGEFTHQGDRCTFEVLVDRFCPDDPSLRAVGEVVHDIDCKDEKFSRPEAAGVAMLLRGIARQHQDDHHRVEAAAPVFESLLAHFAQPEP
ncbi:MAG: chromate resistance protein [Actinomycetota bacterium]|nr:chromate resistance protein [Actinomycetota bacterium]